jgi:hypothetical protein
MVSNKEILKCFQKIARLDYGAKFYKADLHFHTPASQDARGRNRYHFNPYRCRYPKKDDPNYLQKLSAKRESILNDAKKVAKDIVQSFVDQSLSLVAITDHNSLGTIYNDAESKNTMMDLAAPSWYELIDDAAQQVNANAQKTILTILPGVEISTSGAHVLGIFEPQVPRRKIHFIICDLLNEAGFLIEEFGKNPEVGTASVFDTIELIISKGGIPIPAHIDGSDQAMLKLYKINSGAMGNLLANPHLKAVEIVKPSKFMRKDRKLKQPLYNWIDDLRKKKGLFSLAFFQGSDAHDTKSVAKRHTLVKMIEPSFSGLSTAIKMPSSRVRISDFNTINPQGLFIWGLYSEGGFRSKETIRFNRHLNCVSGKKETGKTTLFHTMQSAIHHNFKETANRYKKVILFVEKIENDTSRFYAFLREKNRIQLFNIDPVNHQVNELDLAKADDLQITPKFYHAQKIRQIISDETLFHDFLVKHFGRPCKTNIYKFNKQFAIPHFLEKDREQLFSLTEIKGKYHMAANINFNKGIEKKVHFFDLSTSIRKCFIVCMIIIMNRFGPAIVDAPENDFDNSDITDYLVPVIKKYKDSQQVIIFSNSAILAVNADTDNFILLEPKNIYSGLGIDFRKNLPQLMNVLEGGQRSFYKRNMTYDVEKERGRS